MLTTWTCTLATLAMLSAPSDKGRIDDAVMRLTACKDIRANVCLNAAATLTNAGDKALRPTLNALPKMTRQGMILAMSVFGNVESSRSTKAMIKISFDRKMPVFVRTLGIRTLAVRDGSTIDRTLIKLCRDEDAVVRAAAVRALGNRPHNGDKKVMAALIKAATDPDKTVRVEALLGLGLSGQPTAGPALVKGLSDPEVDVRRVSADGLRHVMYKPSVKPLIDTLQSRDRELRRRCGQALARQTGKNFGEDFPLWREWYKNQ